MKNFFITAIIFTCTLNIVDAQVSFVSNGQQLNRLAGRGVLVSDFNDDGYPDVFVVNEDGPEGNGYRVYFNDGDSKFTDSGQLLANPFSSSGKADIADIIGDGEFEIITGKTIWLHDSNGIFSADTSLFLNSSNDDIYLCRFADLNNDGLIDVFAMVFGTLDLEGRVYLNNGQGKLNDTGQRLGKGSQADVELGDLNGDGYIDAVITGWRNVSTDPCPNRIWLNDGRGNFTETGQVLDEVMRHVHGLTLGDIDSDGDTDLIFGIQTNAPFVRVFHNDGTGRFTAIQNCGSRAVEDLKLADMDNDGDLDLVLACNGPNEIWLNNGSGSFTNSGLRLGSEWTWGIDVGDFNNDGKLDVVAVNMAFDMLNTEPWYIARGRYAEVWLNTTQTTAVENENSETHVPESIELLNNYPNPFNPTTVISYKLSASSNVKLTVHNLLGQKIKTLVNSFQHAGEHKVVWNGTDEFNDSVGSGIYFYSLSTSRGSIQRKMMLLQ